MPFNAIFSWYIGKRMSRINRYRNEPHTCQREVFLLLNKHLPLTAFGQALGISKPLDLRDFQSKIPLQDYTTLKPWIDQSRAGQDNVLWTGKTNWYAKSSGTTADRVKILPITVDSLHHNHYAGGKDLLSLYYHQLPKRKLYNAKHLIIGGSGKIDKGENGIFTGDLSAIIINNLPLWTELRRAPKKDIALLENWEEKLEKMARASLNENICIIAGVPSWTTVLMNKVLAISGKKNIHEVWPNLELYIHGGMNFQPYRTKFEAFLGKPIHFIESYNSSEGYFGLQDELNTQDLLLLTDSQVFFEFIPMAHFKGVDSEKVLTLEEIETDIEYALVISTSSGLWRYIIGDTIRFSSVNPFRFQVTGRTTHFVNAFGEKMIVEHAEKAMAATCEKMNVVLRDYTVGPSFTNSQSTGQHEWLIEIEDEEVNKNLFSSILDEELKKVNSDYDIKRTDNINIGFPLVHFVEIGTFERWLKSKGKLGGQHKVPRLQNNRKLLDELLQLLNTQNLNV